VQIRFIVQQKNVGVWLVPGVQYTGREDREFFQRQMNDAVYRTEFFALLTGLGKEYWIEIAGDKRSADVFQNEESLLEFTKTDQQHYSFIIGRNYAPGDPNMNVDAIAPTILNDVNKLVMLYRHMKDKTFEK
jgi:hypothetical protein